jgi:translocation and assembly module TamA
VAGLDFTVVQERRDDPLNATRGAFLSVNLKVAPQFLGSDFDFLRELVQGVLLFDVGREMVWAQGYRVGAIQTKGGQRLPYDDLFQAGGPTTVRGFATDSLGPRTPAGEAIGGEALLVMNQELRYMNEATGLGGVLFWDAGNVFARLKDLDLKLKHALGVGLRYDSPVGLLRVDLALPLGKRDDDRGYQIYFGIGHSY